MDSVDGELRGLEMVVLSSRGWFETEERVGDAEDSDERVLSFTTARVGSLGI
jgi:hypothetical protein